jgi:hypothetical protein
MSRRLVELYRTVPVTLASIFEKREAKPVSGKQWEEAEFEPEEPAVAPTPEPEKSGPRPAPMPQPAAAAVEKPPQQAQTQAIVRAPSSPEEFAMALEPRSGPAALEMAKHLHNSRLFPRFGSQEAIFAVIVRGRELGIGAITALTLFHFHDGHLTLHAHLIAARAQEHPDCEYFEFLGGDDTYAEYETKHRRNRNPTRLRYTIEQAKLAGLVRPTREGKPSNWMRIPAEMLRKTCSTQLARIVYPAAAMGLYCPEELGHEQAA